MGKLAQIVNTQVIADGVEVVVAGVADGGVDVFLRVGQMLGGGVPDPALRGVAFSGVLGENALTFYLILGVNYALDFYNYVPEDGIGHFIHTYKCDGDPIPSFYGEPEEVSMPNTAEELADLCWNNLNEDNKVSLFVRSIPLDGGEATDIIINKNK